MTKLLMIHINIMGYLQRLCKQSQHEICWSCSYCRREVLLRNRPVGRRGGDEYSDGFLHITFNLTLNTVIQNHRTFYCTRICYFREHTHVWNFITAQVSCGIRINSFILQLLCYSLSKGLRTAAVTEPVLGVPSPSDPCRLPGLLLSLWGPR